MNGRSVPGRDIKNFLVYCPTIPELNESIQYSPDFKKSWKKKTLLMNWTKNTELQIRSPRSQAILQINKLSSIDASFRTVKNVYPNSLTQIFDPYLASINFLLNPIMSQHVTLLLLLFPEILK